MKKLNFGAGRDIRNGWVNSDKYPLKGIDVVCDGNVFPYPFKNGEFDYIYSRDVLNLISDTIGALEELHRISKPGAIIEIIVPDCLAPVGHTDPLIKAQFSTESFREICTGGKYQYYLKEGVRFNLLYVEPVLHWDRPSEIFYSTLFSFFWLLKLHKFIGVHYNELRFVLEREI